MEAVDNMGAIRGVAIMAAVLGPARVIASRPGSPNPNACLRTPKGA
jgi:hypothetical protein